MAKAISAEEVKIIQKSILRQIHDFCSKHQLRYYLAFGTLLGAIRHKGYIPWDDDIDLMMPRPDYLKFIELFEASDNGPLDVVSIQNNPKYFAHFAKIIDTRTVMHQEYGQVEKVEIGVYVDIFPMDGLPDDEGETRKLFAQTKRWSAAYKLSIREFSAKSSNPIKWVLKTLISIPFRIVGSHFFITKLEATGMTNSYDECSSVACVTSSDSLSESIERRFLEECILVEFEGEMYPAPSECDTYLTNIYGDYMKPPPKDQRQKHYYTVYWK